MSLALLAACAANPPPADLQRPRCPDGDVAIQVDADADSLAGCADLYGPLNVGPSFALRSLRGLARLRRVGGGFDVSDNADLSGLFMPALLSIGGDLVIENNRQIATASLHRVAEVTGDLIVRDNRALWRLDLGSLRRVGGRLVIAGHPELEMVALDRLQHAGGLVIEDNPAWPADDIDRLRRRVGSLALARPVSRE